ncbi:MAG TPA: hypothetical protein VMZ28_26070, partial [Kofleriaceae bacterium]|nr:hypothetical protein [Kofleriaceae bacterium]
MKWASGLLVCLIACGESTEAPPPSPTPSPSPSPSPTPSPSPSPSTMDAGVSRGDPATAARILKTFHAARRSMKADDEGAGTGRWLKTLVEDAKAGQVSTVRMPITFCVGWGSEVPSEWTAAGCFTPHAFFVTPTGDTKLLEECTACADGSDPDAYQACKEKRCNLVVEGHFTGALVPPPRQDQHSPSHVFAVERARLGDAAGATLRLPAGAPPVAGAPIADGPRWGVMWAE